MFTKEEFEGLLIEAEKKLGASVEDINKNILVMKLARKYNHFYSH